MISKENPYWKLCAARGKKFHPVENHTFSDHRQGELQMSTVM